MCNCSGQFIFYRQRFFVFLRYGEIYSSITSFFVIDLIFDSHSSSLSCIEVLTNPGQTAFILRPNFAVSLAAECVNPITANLLAE